MRQLPTHASSSGSVRLLKVPIQQGVQMPSGGWCALAGARGVLATFPSFSRAAAGARSAGGAGGRSPLAGAWGVPTFSLALSCAAAGGMRRVPE